MPSCIRLGRASSHYAELPALSELAVRPIIAFPDATTIPCAYCARVFLNFGTVTKLNKWFGWQSDVWRTSLITNPLEPRILPSKGTTSAVCDGPELFFHALRAMPRTKIDDVAPGLAPPATTGRDGANATRRFPPTYLSAYFLPLCYPSGVPRPFLIDTDTASDDAVALIMALRAPDVRVVAITTVAGNVPVTAIDPQCSLYRRTLRSERSGLHRRRQARCSAPTKMRPGFMAAMASEIHNYPRSRRQSARSGHAVDAIIEAVEANPGIVIVTLAPLTNLALALAKKPEIAAKVGPLRDHGRRAVL